MLSIDLRTAAANARSAGRTLALGPEGTEVKPLVAHALSRELQLYFDRLTSAAVVRLSVQTVALQMAESVHPTGRRRNDADSGAGEFQRRHRSARPGSISCTVGGRKGGSSFQKYLSSVLYAEAKAFCSKVVGSLASSLVTLDQCLDILEAMLQNPSLFSEPYVSPYVPKRFSEVLNAL